MSNYIGNLSVFDHKIHDWDVFKGQLTHFIVLNNIPDGHKSAVLLTNLSEESYRLIRNLVYPKKLEESTYNELVKLLDGHFTPKKSTFVDRAKFYEAIKSDGESIEEWAARLRGLAVYCEFGTELDTLLRDRFVLGFGLGPERDRLFECDSGKLTFGEALQVAQKASAARAARSTGIATGITTIKDEPVFHAGRTTRAGDGRAGGSAIQRGHGAGDVEFRCTVCGLKNHNARDCRFKNYKCLKCGQKGHLKKLCDVSKCNLNNFVTENVQPTQENDCKECELFSIRFPN
ncbi:uncharacterized protein LOC119188862 [Manduca sexta]|uniref:uncharacterized protein LOC119188862 n=1 Tax=Manduca sexta TaxID=7130 RepID=UPI00188F5FA6|nr:uncharacterized protein LOC119188862 [Manduca sexta]